MNVQDLSPSSAMNIVQQNSINTVSPPDTEDGYDSDDYSIYDESDVSPHYTTNDIYSDNHPWDTRVLTRYRFRHDIWCSPELISRSTCV